MDRGLIWRILQAYGVQAKAVLPPQKGYRNASYQIKTAAAPLNVIIYKRESDMDARIARAHAVGDFLATQALPARQTYSPRIIRLQNRFGVKYAAIYHYLPGKTIPWETYTMKHLKALGEMMGCMHEALKDFTGDLPSVVAELLALNKRMGRYFADPNVSQALRQKLSLTLNKTDFTTTLRAAQSLPAHALHMDFVRGNILFDGHIITGIIDFEKTARGPAVFDLARTLAFLLVDCKYKPEPKIRKYFVQSGYQKRGGGVIRGDLEGLIDFFLLHDFYKFLRHNPYESLLANQHFTRTVQLMKNRGLLSTHAT